MTESVETGWDTTDKNEECTYFHAGTVDVEFQTFVIHVQRHPDHVPLGKGHTGLGGRQTFASGVVSQTVGQYLFREKLSGRSCQKEAARRLSNKKCEEYQQ